MMARVSNVAVWLVLFAASAAIVPAIVFLDRDGLFETMNAIIMASAAGCAVGHLPAFWHTMRMPYRLLSAGQLLNVSVFVGSVGAVVVFGARWLWRVEDRPLWLSDHAVVAFALWLFTLGYMMALATVGARDGMMPASAYRTAALVTFLACSVSAVLYVIWR